MQVEIVEPAAFGLRTLNSDDQQNVHAWVGHLKNWDNDPIVRKHSLKLPSWENTYVLHAGPELRLFFTKEGEKIEVFDIAKRSVLLAAFGQTSGTNGP